MEMEDDDVGDAEDHHLMSKPSDHDRAIGGGGPGWNPVSSPLELLKFMSSARRPRRMVTSASRSHRSGRGSPGSRGSRLSAAAGCFNPMAWAAWGQIVLHSPFYRNVCKGYDVAAQMMIACVWAYLVPLAVRPHEGCPRGGHKCWDFCGFLLAYVLACTLLLPLVAVASIHHCASRRGAEMGTQRENTPWAAVRRAFHVRVQTLFLGAVGTTWSVANSQFAWNAIRQVAYTGFHFSDGGLTELEIGGGGGGPSGGEVHWNGTALLPGGLLHRGLQGGGDGVFVTNSSARLEMQWGILASFCFGVAYFGLAVLSISSVSMACRCSLWSLETIGRGCSQSAYLVELSMLMQNNWCVGIHM